MQCGPNSGLFLAAGLLLAAVGCSGDDSRDAKSHDAAGAADAGDTDASDPDDELRQIIAESIAAYDRQVESSCPCFVENGGYESVDECLMWQKSADHWVSCGTDAIKAYDSPALRDGIRCLVERADANIACNDMIACNSPERETCNQSLIQCFAQVSEVLLVLDGKCPDFGLIPRQPTGQVPSE